MRELAEMVIELTGSKSAIDYRPLPQDDPLQRQPDIAQARERLGWEPLVPLREGLARTIAYFEAKLEGQTLEKLLTPSVSSFNERVKKDLVHPFAQSATL